MFEVEYLPESVCFTEITITTIIAFNSGFLTNYFWVKYSSNQVQKRFSHHVEIIFSTFPKTLRQKIANIIKCNEKTDRKCTKSSLPLSTLCPATWISSVPEHLSSDSPFSSPAHCTRLLPFQHSITAAWSPGDVSLLRSDVVRYANRPSRLLLLTRPNPYFSRHIKTHSCTQTDTHAHIFFRKMTVHVATM